MDEMSKPKFSARARTARFVDSSALMVTDAVPIISPFDCCRTIVER